MKFHVKLQLIGNKEKQDFYHFLLRKMDRDWPFKMKKWNIEEKKMGWAVSICKVCGGGIWNEPRFEPKGLKALGKQVNEMKELPGHLKVKIRGWKRHEICVETMMKEREV